MHTSTMRRRGQQNMAQIPDDHKTNHNENYLPVKNRIWKLNNRTVATSLFEGFSDGLVHMFQWFRPSDKDTIPHQTTGPKHMYQDKLLNKWVSI